MRYLPGQATESAIARLKATCKKRSISEVRQELAIWAKLWNDFNTRVERLLDRNTDRTALQGAIDNTILWQLHGRTCYAPTAHPPLGLHLPELYSGAPWLKQKRWIAFVTLNPNINSNEIFPTRADVLTEPHDGTIDQARIEEVVPFFDERFCSPLKERSRRRGTLRHGRGPDDGAVSWLSKNGRILASRQRTWRLIETALLECLKGTQLDKERLPLGTFAAITDSVPWKFADWGNLPKHVKPELMMAGEPYLKELFMVRPPSLIITCGADLRALGNDHFLAGNDAVQTLSAPVPRFNVSAPTAHPSGKTPLEWFHHQMLAKRDLIREVLLP